MFYFTFSKGRIVYTIPKSIKSVVHSCLRKVADFPEKRLRQCLGVCRVTGLVAGDRWVFRIVPWKISTKEVILKIVHELAEEFSHRYLTVS